MCGIVGRAGLRAAPGDAHAEAEALLRRQLKTFAYRGPDADGTLVREGIAFGHARLSIIDLSPTGAQPMLSADGRYAITYNGEIYNYVELRAELEKLGATFRGSSDTEVVLAAFAHWGPGALERFNGMFAFALYDFRERTLVCARDPYGQKPLYYLAAGGELHFASEARAFREIPGFDARIDPESIAQYLADEGFYGDRSVYAGVSKLLPGHRLTWRDGDLRVERYYKSVPAPDSTRIGLAEAIDRVDAALRESVRLALRADVPVGLLLSGGLDSSLVLAYHRQVLPGGRIRAFHAQMDDPTYDESAYARQAAEAMGVELEVFKLGLPELAELARTVPGRLDEPQADPGILPKFFVCREIAKTHKVALTGDGSDELFYGYLLFKAQRMAKYYRHVPAGVHTGIVAPLARLLPTGVGYMRTDFLAKQFVRGFPATDALRASAWMRSFSDADLQALMRDPEAARRGVARANAFLTATWEEAPDAGHAGQLAYRMQRTYLPDYVLCNSDRASMLNSLELRSPLLDPNVARLANSLPDRLKMPGMSTKSLLKKVAERHLPRSLIYRKKIGFTVPMADLLRTSLRDDVRAVLGEDRLRRQGLFDPTTVTRMLDLHESGRANLYKPLWTLYSLQKWLDP